ncbi:MAG: SusC/RagA family TonB-linked outer membrane protein [Flavobacteriaceae bacterium]|nr:SusC/RagA family TonB-linked outer membrane protein [Flavobacteriaceae bacterium]
MRTNFKIVLTLLGIIFCGTAFAQTGTVKGIVVDQSNLPISGVNVVVVDANKGDMTKFDGDFIIDKVEQGNVKIQFSYLGFSTKTVDVVVKPNTVVDLGTIVLMESAEQLNEIVVTALGIKRETKKLGYSVQEVSGDELAKAKETNVVNSLSGKFSGVQVTGGNSGVGSTSVISIRGEGSLIPGNNSPLFIVDGIPISNGVSSNKSEGNMETDYGNGAQDINPDDIESMSVLKGPNATALYGSRGANGVILITTKSGKRARGLGISFTNSTTFESVLRLPQWQDKYGQGQNGDFVFGNGGFESNINTGTNDGVDESWGPALDGRLIVQHDSPTSSGYRAGDTALRPRDASGAYTDTATATPWVANPNNIEDFFQTGTTVSNNLSLNGANENGNFRISLTDLQSKGILPNTDYNRRSYSLSGSYNLKDWLKISSSLNYINSFSKNRPNNSYGTENIMYLWVWFGRQIDMNSLRNYWQPGLEGVQQYNYNYNWHDNPYFTMYENTNAFDKHRLIGNVRADITLNENISLMLRSGIDYFNDLRTGKRAFSTQRFARGQYREDDIFFKEQNTDFLLAFNKNLSEDLTLGASVGGNLRTVERRYKRISANSLSVPNVYNFQNANEPLSKTQDNNKREVQSLYAFANIAYKDYLFLDITGRNDWSSTLPKGNNSYFYPSVGVSAILSDMFTMPKAISFAKLRAGWAQVGNDTDPYNIVSTYAFREAFNGVPRVAAFSTLKNADLKPEKTNSIELGADLRFFNNRIGLDVAVYQSNVRNQILSLPVSQTSGLSNRIINAGEVENKGIELTLNLKPIQTENFGWNIHTNFTANRGEVKELIGDLKTYQIAENNGVQILAKIGERVGDMYGTGFEMVDGKILYENGLPVRSSELVKLGNYNPDFMVGIQNSFRYKNFNLGILFDWRQGGEIHSRTVAIGGTTGMLDFTAEGRETGIVGDGVRADGNGGYVPNDVNVAASAYYSSTYSRGNEAVPIYDATYVKLRELKLTYNFPSSIIDKTPLQAASFSLVGRNLALWTENDHVDPETFSFSGNTIVQGLEDMATPSAKSIGFSLNVQF